MNSIFIRRSCRKFSDESVCNEEIELLLKAGFQAPSAGNQQPWEFVVVQNKEVIERLSHSQKYAAFIKNASLVIVPIYRTNDLVFEDYVHIDMGNACENIWLEATELDLGCTWVGIAPRVEVMTYVNQILNLDKNHQAFALLAIGHKKEELPYINRYNKDKVTYIK